jgi:hypothetical protein
LLAKRVDEQSIEEKESWAGAVRGAIWPDTLGFEENKFLCVAGPAWSAL